VIVIADAIAAKQLDERPLMRDGEVLVVETERGGGDRAVVRERRCGVS
jgi:hypothetical protein